jgi:hypothetical protein
MFNYRVYDNTDRDGAQPCTLTGGNYVPISLTLKGASEETGLSVRILYRLIAEGKLETRTIGRRRLILAKSLKDLIIDGLPRSPVAEKALADLAARGVSKGRKNGQRAKEGRRG